MESYQGGADEDYRGRNGPLKVTESNESGPLYEALIKAAGEVGIAYTKDYNGAQPGRHRHDPDDHPRRPAHEHRATATSIPRAAGRT